MVRSCAETKRATDSSSEKSVGHSSGRSTEQFSKYSNTSRVRMRCDHSRWHCNIVSEGSSARVGPVTQQPLGNLTAPPPRGVSVDISGKTLRATHPARLSQKRRRDIERRGKIRRRQTHDIALPGAYHKGKVDRSRAMGTRQRRRGIKASAVGQSQIVFGIEQMEMCHQLSVKITCQNERGKAILGTSAAPAKSGAILPIGEAGNAAAHTGYEKTVLGVRTGKGYKLIDIWLYHSTPARMVGMAYDLPVRPFPYPPFSAEFPVGYTGGSAVVFTREVLPKTKISLSARLSMLSDAIRSDGRAGK